MPKRVQLQRVKGWRMPPNTRKVDRTTIFGNPFEAVRYGTTDAVRSHRVWLTGVLTDEQIQGQYPGVAINTGWNCRSAERARRRSSSSGWHDRVSATRA